MTMSNKVLRKKLSSEVRERIEIMIRDEIYPVGSFLPPERELMTLFQVGRPSVREALYQLETMGLVQLMNGGRPKVTHPTPVLMLEQLSGTARLLLERPEGVEYFDQLRLFLEMGTARHAAEFATKANLEALEIALANNERAIPRASAFAATDVAFHEVLTAIPGNPIFLAVHQALVEWLIDQRPKAINTEAENRVSFEGHRRIAQAILERNPERAGEAMREHLENARRKFSASAATLPNLVKSNPVQARGTPQ